MKKTILAATMAALFASTTQAATVYEKEGITVDIFGDTEIVYINSLDENESDEISIDDADFGFELGYALSDDITLTGLVEFGASSGTSELSDAYVGVTSNKWGRLTVGKQTTLYDDSGIGNDYQFGFSNFYEQDASGAQVIKYKVDKGMYYGGIAYLMNSESGQTDGTEGFDGNIGVRVADFDLTVFYADMKTAADHDSTNVNVELRYQLNEKLQLSAAYARTDADLVEADPLGITHAEWGDTDIYGLTAVYQANSKLAFAAGWAYMDSEAAPDLENQYYVNTSYAFNDYIEVYAELGGNDGDDTELGYATGMIVAF